MTISPTGLKVLLHLFTVSSPYPQNRETWFDNLMTQWTEDGIVRAKGDTYELTHKGCAWMEMILATPMPVERWCDPRVKV